MSLATQGVFQAAARPRLGDPHLDPRLRWAAGASRASQLRIVPTAGDAPAGVVHGALAMPDLFGGRAGGESAVTVVLHLCPDSERDPKSTRQQSEGGIGKANVVCS